ncbi:MAG: hypothetical protein CUN53_04095, partial [Phototrophicales bacterium]
MLRRVAPLEWLTLAAILLLAGVLRFGWSGVSSFAWDEANLSLDALRTARGGQIALAGQPSSVAIPFFPASVYAFAIPYDLSPDPLIAVGFVSALSLLTVFGVWALGRTMLDSPGVGLLAALFLAASPYAVLYGRSIWQPNLLPPLALAWLATAWRAVTAGDRRALALHIFLGGAIVQVHFAGIALAAATVFLFLVYRWWRHLVPVIIGAAGALLLALPYGAFLAQTPDILSRYADVLSGETRYDGVSFENTLKLALGWDWSYLGGGIDDPTGRNVVLSALAGALIAVGSVGLIRRGIPRQARTLVMVALLASPVFFIRHSTPVLPHYQLVALPAVAILIGAGWRTGIGGRVAFVGAVLLAAAWTAQLASVLSWVSVERPSNSALSSILNEPRDAVRAIYDPVVVHLHGDDPRIEGEAAVFNALLWERPHRIVNGTVLLVLPPEPATLLTTLAPFQAWEELQAGGLADSPTAYPRRQGALPFMAARYDGAALPVGFNRVDPVSFADGTALLGWKVRWVGPRFRISTLWRAGDVASDATIQQFHHLRVPDGLDGAPFMGSDVPLALHTWRPGDHVVVMADFFDVPPGEYLLDVGHYTLPE